MPGNPIKNIQIYDREGNKISEQGSHVVREILHHSKQKKRRKKNTRIITPTEAPKDFFFLRITLTPTDSLAELLTFIYVAFVICVRESANMSYYA